MNDKNIFRIIIGISIFVFLVVLILNKKLLPVPEQIPSFVPFLPKLNAILNGSCSILLLTSLYFIKRKNIVMHKRINIVAFLFSSLFLVSYIVFHYFAKETHFGDINHDDIVDGSEKAQLGSLRTVYFVILISHIILAALVLPLVLLSFQRGLMMQVEKHIKGIFSNVL